MAKCKGTNHYLYGKHMSEETKLKLSIVHKGKTLSKEHRRKIGEKSRINNLISGNRPPSRLGIKSTEEHKRKIGIASKGNKYRLGKKMSIESRTKISEAKKGSNSPLWKGGISPINKIIRRGLRYKLWRESVFERDSYTCQICGIKSGMGVAVELHPHHLKPFALFPELRFDLSNGQTLCASCHKLTDSYANKLNINKSVWL